jgi:hypothetical protein
VGGIPEILGANSRALAIPGDAADLSRIMVESLTIPGWHQINMPEPITFRQRFSTEAMARDVLEAYEAILET